MFALSIDDNRSVTLRVLFCWRKGVDVFWVYPEEAEFLSVGKLTEVRPLGLVGVVKNLLLRPECAHRVHRLGYCALTPEEESLPVFNWGGEIYKRDRLVLSINWNQPDISTVMAVRSERFPGLGVAAFEALVCDIRDRCGCDQKSVLDLMERLRSQHEEVRHAATVSLGWLGRVGAQPAIDQLIAVLQDDESYMVRRGAARALGHVGLGRQDAMKTLEGCRNDRKQGETRETRGTGYFSLAVHVEAR